MTEREIRAEIKRRAEADGMAALARAWNVSRIYLYQVVSGERTPGPAILRRLGLRRVVTVTYVPTGRPHDSA